MKFISALSIVALLAIVAWLAPATASAQCCLTVTNNLNCTVTICWTNPQQCVQVPPHISQQINLPCNAAPFQIQTSCGLETMPKCPTQMKRQIGSCCAWICIDKSPIGCLGWIKIDPAAAPCGCP